MLVFLHFFSLIIIATSLIPPACAKKCHAVLKMLKIYSNIHSDGIFIETSAIAPWVQIGLDRKKRAMRGTKSACVHMLMLICLLV